MTKIWLPDSRIVRPVAEIKWRLAGWYKLTAIRPDGTERPLTDWFPNLITDYGLNRMGNGTFISHALVGTGNSTPVVADTGLQSFTASQGTAYSSTTGASSTPPYYGFNRRTWRFGAGAAAGNLAEVGVGHQSSNGGLFSRALILDHLDAPTIITVLSDEYLDVTYELRCYAPTVDAAYDVDISGITYSCISRVAQATSVQHWFPDFSEVGYRSVFGTIHTVYNGAIAAVTASPSGAAAGGGTASNQTYSNNSLYRDMIIDMGLDNANVSGGISSTQMNTTLGAFQTSFSPNIPKDLNKVLALSYRVSWDRYTAGSP